MHQLKIFPLTIELSAVNLNRSMYYSRQREAYALKIFLIGGLAETTAWIVNVIALTGLPSAL